MPSTTPPAKYSPSWQLRIEASDSQPPPQPAFAPVLETLFMIDVRARRRLRSRRACARNRWPGQAIALTSVRTRTSDQVPGHMTPSIRWVTSARAARHLSAFAFTLGAARQDLHHFDPGTGQHRVERLGELPGPIPDQEPEPDPLAARWLLMAPPTMPTPKTRSRRLSRRVRRGGGGGGPAVRERRPAQVSVGGRFETRRRTRPRPALAVSRRGGALPQRRPLAGGVAP